MAKLRAACDSASSKFAHIVASNVFTIEVIHRNLDSSTRSANETRRAFDLSAYLRAWLAGAPKATGKIKLEVDVDPQSFL